MVTMAISMPTLKTVLQYLLVIFVALLLDACSSADTPESTVDSIEESQSESLAAKIETLGINWFEGSVEAAFAEAKVSDRPLFLYWGAKWCPYCKQVKATIFTRRDVIDRTRHFVSVELDGDAPAAQQAGERYGVMGYPTMIVFSSNREELTRIPNGLDVESYAGIFDLALNSVRPIAESLRAALAGDVVSDADWERLSVYSWGQDNDRALGDRVASDMFEVLADECPTSVAPACMRLAMNYLEAAIEIADEVALEPSVRARAFENLTTLLDDEELIWANIDAVLHAGPEFVVAVTDRDSAEQAALSEHWQSVMARLADDNRMSIVEQFYASYAPVGFARMHDPDAVIVDSTRQAIQERVALAMQTTTDSIERHAVVTTAASLLRAVDLPAEASVLLERELAQSKQPFYLMSSLASTAENEGDVEGALNWRERAYVAATGTSTRFRWGYGYVSSVLRLASNDVPRIELLTNGLFAELGDPATAFYGGTQSRAANLSDKLIEWADNAEREEALTRIRSHLDSICTRIPADELARERCDGFLAGASS